MLRSFLSSASALVRASLDSLVFLMRFSSSMSLVALVVGLAQLALDRLHLLVQIIFALGLLHLALHARADLLLDLQDADLAFHQAKTFSRRFDDVEDFQQVLLVGDLDRQVGGDAVGQLAGSAIWGIEPRASGGTFLFSFT